CARANWVYYYAMDYW
nr:immunoglobulin heavy chain junction region [Mus musculus]